MSTLHVLSYDPGVTTGWCWLRMPASGLLTDGFTQLTRARAVAHSYGEVDCKNERAGTDGMVAVLRSVWGEVDDDSGDVLLIAIEDFVLRQSTRDRELLSPVRLTARFRDRMREIPLALWLFSPSDSMNICNDQRLRSWGLYVAGPDHIKDATRGAVLASRKYQSEEPFRVWVGGRQQS
jgi:hypothetical protein